MDFFGKLGDLRMERRILPFSSRDQNVRVDLLVLDGYQCGLDPLGDVDWFALGGCVELGLQSFVSGVVAYRYSLDEPDHTHRVQSVWVYALPDGRGRQRVVGGPFSVAVDDLLLVCSVVGLQLDESRLRNVGQAAGTLLGMGGRYPRRRAAG